jgi:FKBP-type peptidyl-prolyl cis-trans isomerase
LKKILLSLLLVPALSFASALKTDTEKLSYTLGATVGKQLAQEQFSINGTTLIQGLDDALTGKKPQLTQEQMKLALGELQKNPPKTKSSTKDLKSTQNRASYTIGSIIAGQLKAGRLPLDNKILYSAITDMLNGKKAQLTDQEMTTIMTGLQEKQIKERQMSADVNLKEGQLFLKENAKKKGIKTLANGVQYKVVKKGDGKTHPTKASTVEVHYEGKLINGSIFDSSYQRGQTISFPLTGVIKGWTETIPLMTKGATWIIYIPSDLAYGARGAGANIGPNSTLIFKVELINIK